VKKLLAALALSVGIAGACADGSQSEPAAGPTPTPSATASPDPEPSPSATPPEAFSFVVMGDWGSGLSDQQRVADRMCAFHENRPYNLVITTGDNVYPDGHPDRFEQVFFRPYDCLFDAGVRFRATLGNHDVMTRNGRSELNEPAFGMKARNYIVRKRGVRLVLADSNELNREWLRRALDTEDGDRWTVVVFHHPVRSSGEHGSTPGFHTLPDLFVRKGVDLVLNGHDHNYEVTTPLRGIRYVVTGGGGAVIRPCGEPQWFTDVCTSRYHFLYVTAGPESITVRAILPSGRRLDSFTTRGRD
jgi:hypothetical protein